MDCKQQLVELVVRVRPKYVVAIVGATNVNKLVVPRVAVRKSSPLGAESWGWLGDGDFIFPSDERVEVPLASTIVEALRPIANGECCLHRYSDDIDSDEVALEGNPAIGAIIEVNLPFVALLVPEGRIDGCFDEGFSELCVKAVCRLVQEF